MTPDTVAPLTGGEIATPSAMMTEQEISDQLAAMRLTIEEKLGGKPVHGPSTFIDEGLEGRPRVTMHLYRPVGPEGPNLWMGTAETVEEVLEDAWAFLRDLPDPKERAQRDVLERVGAAAEAAERVGASPATVADFRRAQHRLALELGGKP